MVKVARYSSDQEMVEVVIHWVNLLAKGDFEAFGAALGYNFADGEAAECVRRSIAGYRSQEYYPNEEVFSVTNWREARGGNPEPRCEIVRYEPNASMLAGAVTVDLRVNGKWSDLHADFVLMDRASEFELELKLEEIYFPCHRI